MTRSLRLVTIGLLSVSLLLLCACATTITLPGGVRYSSTRNVSVTNLVIVVKGSNTTIRVGGISASASEPIDATTRQIQAIGAIVGEAAGKAVKP